MPIIHSACHLNSSQYSRITSGSLSNISLFLFMLNDPSSTTELNVTPTGEIELDISVVQTHQTCVRKVSLFDFPGRA
jgi:hypothetical protein